MIAGKGVSGWRLWREGRREGGNGDVQLNVPTDAIRKTRKGSVRPLMAWYFLLAPQRPAVPTARPPRPPMVPPLTVSLDGRR